MSQGKSKTPKKPLPLADRALPAPRSRNLVWRVIQTAVQVVFLFWLRFRCQNKHRLKEVDGALLLINHQSMLDPMLVGVALNRPVSFLARDSLFRIPVIGWVLRNAYVMPINRDSASTASVREMVRRLKHGFLVGIFPEGTRTHDGEVGKIKPGFVAVTKRAGVPVIPVGIAGAGKALPRNALFLWPYKVTLYYGDPIPAEEVTALSQRGREAEFSALIHKRLKECQEAAEQMQRRKSKTTQLETGQHQ